MSEIDAEIAGFYLCAACLRELHDLSLATGQPMSPKTYSRLMIGANAAGTHLIIRCRRHEDGLVAVVELARPAPPTCACDHEH